MNQTKAKNLRKQKCLFYFVFNLAAKTKKAKSLVNMYTEGVTCTRTVKEGAQLLVTTHCAPESGPMQKRPSDKYLCWWKALMGVMLSYK